MNFQGIDLDIFENQKVAINMTAADAIDFVNECVERGMTFEDDANITTPLMELPSLQEIDLYYSKARNAVCWTFSSAYATLRNYHIVTLEDYCLCYESGNIPEIDWQPFEATEVVIEVGIAWKQQLISLLEERSFERDGLHTIKEIGPDSTLIISCGFNQFSKYGHSTQRSTYNTFGKRITVMTWPEYIRAFNLGLAHDLEDIDEVI